MRVGNRFTHQRQRRIAWRINFADHAPEVEFEISVELACKLLHAAVVSESVRVQWLGPAIARAKERSFEESCPHPSTLPRLSDAEGGSPRRCENRSEGPQLSSAAQDAVDEEAVEHYAQLPGG